MVLSRFGMFLVMFGAAACVGAGHAYASGFADSESGSIRGDVADNPLAQEILQKIEQTREWIAELEQRSYERLQEQEELEHKRQMALAKMNQDLKEWENLWEYYSPRDSFERFVEKVPDLRVQEVFWDQFGFKEQRVEAGREAFKRAVAGGGTIQNAISAYTAAAETKRIELIEANSQFNIRQGLAYYGQQMLFEEDGRFVDSASAEKQLYKYYEDYATNPAYIAANPDDKSALEAGRTNQDTQCRDGHTAVHRLHANDFVCTTMETAEMWISLGMGEIVGQSAEGDMHKEMVNPLTRCDDGFSLILNVGTGKYSCIMADTASSWIEQGLARTPDPEEFIRDSIEKKEAHRLAGKINDEILETLNELDSERGVMSKEYGEMLADAIEQAGASERELTSQYGNGNGMTAEKLSAKILQIREDLEDEEKKIQRNQARAMKSLEMQYQEELESMALGYGAEPRIEMIKHGKLSYEAVVSE